MKRVFIETVKSYVEGFRHLGYFNIRTVTDGIFWRMPWVTDDRYGTDDWYGTDIDSIV